MKAYTRKAVSLLLAVLMVVSMLTVVTLPAATALTLTDNDVIVDLSWTESTVPATYTFGGKTYDLTWGSNAFSVLQTAVDTASAGANVILCPGTYSTTTYIKKNLQILGPKAGIDPNVRGATETGDWTANSQRGSNEADVTAVWHLGVNGATVYSAMTAVTIDGITVTGQGQLRSNSGTAGHADITLRNIILKDSAKTTQPFFFRTYYGTVNNYMRNIVVENLRLQGTAASQVFAIAAESLDISGLYMPAGYSKVLFDALCTSWSDASTDVVSFRVHDCMFRDSSITRPIYMNVQTSACTANSMQLNRDIADKAMVTVKADHNVFYNPDSGSTSTPFTAAFAINTENAYVEITDNTFISTTATISNYVAAAGYSGDTSLSYADRVTVRKNRFIGIGTAFSFTQAGGTVDLTGNYFETIGGAVTAPVAGSSTTTKCDWYYTDPDFVGRSSDPTPRFDQTDDDILVCSAWASGTPATYQFEDHIYTLTAGVNAFSDLDDAIAATPAGGTLIVGPGTYGAATFSKAIVIRGAMAGYTPNEEGATYLEDWELSEKWNGAQTIVNGEWTFNADATVDGVTLTGDGRLVDGGTVASANFEWRDILITGYTSTNRPLNPYHSPSNVLSRSIVIEDVRIIGLTTANAIFFRANDLAVRRVYMDSTCTKKLIDGYPTDNDNNAATVTVSDCMLRTYTTQVINARARNNSDSNTNIDNKARVTMNIQNNVFYGNNTEATGTSNAIAIQWSSSKTYFNITGNTVVGLGTPKSAFTGISAYGIKDGNLNAFGSMGGQFVITRNRFINVPTAIALGSYSTTNVPLDGNYYETASGAAIEPTHSGSVTLDWYYLDRAMTKRSDGGSAEEVIPAERLYDIETEVRWFGRTYIGTNAEHYFNWTNSGFEFNFHGTGATAQIMSSNPGGTNTGYLVVYVDGVRQSPDVEMTFSKANVVLAENLADGNHHIKVVKRTNGRSSTAALSRLWIAEGSTKLAPPLAPCRKMEFIGDSITVGYGSINTGSSSWNTGTEDGTITYAALTAQYFGADNHTIAISGRGIVRNTGGDDKKLMPVIYKCIDYTMCTDYESGLTADKLYDYDLYQPQVVVINLGTNDASSNNSDLTAAEFKTGCKAFIQQVRAARPDAIIIYAYEFMSTKYSTQAAECVAELKAAGDNNVYYLTLPTCAASEKYLGHPNAAAHADRSTVLINKVAEVTGWTESTGSDHLWNAGVVTTAATCTSTGVRTYTCTECGATRMETIPQAAHSWNSDYTVDVEPTSTTDGQKSIHCSVCNAIQPGSIVVLPATLEPESSDLGFFDLSVQNSVIQPMTGDRFSILAEMRLDVTDAYTAAADAKDIKVLDYGVLYGTSMDVVTDYIARTKAGASIDGMQVVRYHYESSETGVARLYSTFSYRFKNVKPNKARGLACFVRYECDGDVYEEFSPVGGAATFAGGYINGVGPTLEESDGLDD